MDLGMHLLTSLAAKNLFMFLYVSALPIFYDGFRGPTQHKSLLAKSRLAFSWPCRGAMARNIQYRTFTFRNGIDQARNWIIETIFNQPKHQYRVIFHRFIIFTFF